MIFIMDVTQYILYTHANIFNLHVHILFGKAGQFVAT